MIFLWLSIHFNRFWFLNLQTVALMMLYVNAYTKTPFYSYLFNFDYVSTQFWCFLLNMPAIAWLLWRRQTKQIKICSVNLYNSYAMLSSIKSLAKSACAILCINEMHINDSIEMRHTHTQRNYESYWSHFYKWSGIFETFAFFSI